MLKGNKGIVLAVFSLLTVMIIGCGNDGRMLSNLERIDVICDSGYYDSAYSELKKIEYEDLKSEDILAYYNLLLTESALNVEIRLPEEDSLINSCVRYYENIYNPKQLVRAYYNKGIYLLGKDDLANSLLFLKKAEAVDREMELSQMRFLINVNISYVNSLVDANKIGLRYAKEALACAERLGNIQLKCFALNNVALCFYGLGLRDSADVYIKKVFPYINDIKRDEDRAVLITNVGVLYFENKQYENAEPLFRRALGLLPVSTTRINLAKTCYMLGDAVEGDSLFNVAWPEASAEEKAEILQFRAEEAERNGLFSESARYYKSAQAMQDSIRRGMKTEEAVSAQHGYEQERYKADVGRRAVAVGAMVLAAVVLIVLAIVAYYRKRINRAKRTITEGNRLIAEYTARISELEKQDAGHADKVRELKRKIRTLRDGQAAVLGGGQRLYDDIAGGGTTAMWKKKDFDEFIEFYRLNHAAAVASAENDYSRLSSTNIFYLLLVDMERGESDIQRIMCLTDGALRTMKSRIKAKRIA